MKKIGTLDKSSAISVALFLIAASLMGAAWPDVARPAVIREAGYPETDIRVWLEGDMDIYPSESDLVFYVRSARDCYATVYVVDTGGFIHVVYPLSPYDDAFIRGGVVYRFHPDPADIFFSSYPRGIAYVFAVSSPVPFVYADFGFDVFGGLSIYRIYGDPFIACKRFYLSLLPPRIMLSRVSVSFSYFYIREWVSYPRYLCLDGDYRYDPSSAYRTYRRHHRDPYRVLRPTSTFGVRDGRSAGIVRVKGVRRNHVGKRAYRGSRYRSHQQIAERFEPSRRSDARMHGKRRQETSRRQVTQSRSRPRNSSHLERAKPSENRSENGRRIVKKRIKPGRKAGLQSGAKKRFTKSLSPQRRDVKGRHEKVKNAAGRSRTRR